MTHQSNHSHKHMYPAFSVQGTGSGCLDQGFSFSLVLTLSLYENENQALHTNAFLVNLYPPSWFGGALQMKHGFTHDDFSLPTPLFTLCNGLQPHNSPPSSAM